MDKNTPGWNDPPMMTNLVPDANKPRNFLNKRVAYPMSALKTEPVKQNYSSVLPPPAVTASPAPPSKPIIVNESLPEEQCFADLSRRIDKLTEAIESDSKKPEILKRLDVMKKMWQEGKLNTEIHDKLSKFFELIESNEIDAANEIYMSLAMHSAALCSSWIIALKYVIHWCKARGS